jgi:hypothetical protein
MKCAICNNEISDEEIEENCITCMISDAKGITISEMAELWQSRAEKAESELKAIKDRIEKIHIDDICEITHHLIETLDTAESITLDEKIFNFIKQIGGEK